MVKSKRDMNILVKLSRQALPNIHIIPVEVLLAGFSTLFENPDRYVKSAALSIKKASLGNKCVDLVGHSLGGFIIRAYTQFYSL